MDTMTFFLERYTDEYRLLWNRSLAEVRQSSFLFNRDFMEYHKNRFKDLSLIIFDSHHNVIGLFPAAVSCSRPDTVESHGGLTYGGLLLTLQGTVQLVNNIITAISAFYHRLGYIDLVYKPVPYIYRKYPCEEDIYALYLHRAQLCTRAVSSVIDLHQPCPFSKLRKRKVRKAAKFLRYEEVIDVSNVSSFWRLLHQVLSDRHHTSPVHSLVELEYLLFHFPQQIRIFMASRNDTSNVDSKIVAGCMLFICDKVIHVQYIAASDEGCELCALDGLFDYLLRVLPDEYPQIPFFDFGISTEEGGRFLNEGLIFQKEGFGARAVCYDSYVLKLE